MNKYLYFAYGMNTNIDSMAIRCPNARDLGKAFLLDHKMVFKYHCDVIEQAGSDAPGVLWEITDDCLASLDVLEGYPTYYQRKWSTVLHNGQRVNTLVYYMPGDDLPGMPAKHYYDMVLQGYKEHGISEEPLIDGLPARAYSV